MAIVRPNIYGTTFTEDPLAGERRAESRKRSENAQRHIGAVSQAWLRDLAIKDALAKQREAARDEEWAASIEETDALSSPFYGDATSESGIPLTYIDQMRARDDQIKADRATERAAIERAGIDRQEAVNQLLLDDRGETEPFGDMQARLAGEQGALIHKQHADASWGNMTADMKSRLASRLLGHEQRIVGEAERVNAEKLRRALLVQSGLEEPVGRTDESGDRMEQIELLKRLLAEQRLFGERPRLP